MDVPVPTNELPRSFDENVRDDRAGGTFDAVTVLPDVTLTKMVPHCPPAAQTVMLEVPDAKPVRIRLLLLIAVLTKLEPVLLDM
jgi:hypothetical protein